MSESYVGTYSRRKCSVIPTFDFSGMISNTFFWSRFEIYNVEIYKVEIYKAEIYKDGNLKQYEFFKNLNFPINPIYISERKISGEPSESDFSSVSKSKLL